MRPCCRVRPSRDEKLRVSSAEGDGWKDLSIPAFPERFSGAFGGRAQQASSVTVNPELVAFDRSSHRSAFACQLYWRPENSKSGYSSSRDRLALLRYELDEHASPVVNDPHLADEMGWHLRCVAISPDGELVATGDHRAVVVRQWSDGRVVGRAELADRWESEEKLDSGFDYRSQSGSSPWKYANYFAVNCVAFSPDGERLIAGAQQGRLALMDERARPTAFWQAHQGDVEAVAFHPRRQMVASAGADRVTVTPVGPRVIAFRLHRTPIGTFSMRTRHKLAVLMGVCLLLLLAITLGVTPAGYVLLGHLRNEAFYDDRPVSYWASELDSSDQRRRSKAAHALNELGPSAESAVAPLARALERPARTDREYKFRFAVMGALQKMGPAADDAVPALVGAIDDPNPFAKWGAIFALRAMGPAASEALPALRREVEDPVALTRVIAAEAICDISGRREEGVATLNDVIKGSDASAGMMAIHALNETERGEPHVIEALVKILNHETRDVTSLAAAARVIADLGPEARVAIPALRRLQNHENERVRQAALAAVTELESDAAGNAEPPPATPGSVSAAPQD